MGPVLEIIWYNKVLLTNWYDFIYRLLNVFPTFQILPTDDIKCVETSVFVTAIWI